MAADLLASFDTASRALLARYGFDATTFARLLARARTGAQAFEDNVVRGRIEPPPDSALTPLPDAGSSAYEELAQRGRAAIAAGEVGVVILAGGMATRFGGGVKAAAQVFPGHSFFDLRIRDAKRAAELAGGRVPVFMLVSFATDEVVNQLARAAESPAVPIEVVPQFISVRLTPQGEVFRDADGKPSFYAPGHGDLTFALRRSGALDRFRAQGGRVLFMANVDNLAATLEPAVIGAHLAHGAALTVEVVRRQRGDTGGAPALVDGKLKVVEGFRFPRGFDHDSLQVFNTNTIIFDAGAIDRDFDLTWFCVKKTLDGTEVLQFERLVGQVSDMLPAIYLVVPREGVQSRFEPVKDPDELGARREQIRALLAARGLL